jgi:hypothetical protein
MYCAEPLCSSIVPCLDHGPVRPLEFVNTTLKGRVNTSDEGLLANIRYAIRQGHPQARPEPPKPDHVAIVGSGVSLKHTEQELRQLVFEGARIVTLNGAYHWCIERNIRPWMQIVMDARPTNARFLTPEIPNCTYWLASQCHADLWATVKDYEKVRIFHAANPDGMEKPILDAYYGGWWTGVTGGTTVGTRAIGLLRMLGFLRFDLFGIDSCWMDGEHHAFEQPENAKDRAIRVKVQATDGQDEGREFVCAPWMLKQAEDFFEFIKSSGHLFKLQVHGDGLIAYAIARNGTISTE